MENENKKITPERLAEIEAREAKATPGPWGVHEGVAIIPAGRDGSLAVFVSFNVEGQGEANAELAAHARQDVPDLCAEIWRAWGENGAERDRRGEAEAENGKLREELAEARAREATPERIEEAARDVFGLFGDKAHLLDLAPSEVRAAIAQAFGLESEASE